MATSGGIQSIDPASNKARLVDPSPTLDLAVDGDSVWGTHVDLGGPPPCNDTSSTVTHLFAASPGESGTYPLPCSFYVTVADNDVWVATLGAIPAVVRLHPEG